MANELDSLTPQLLDDFDIVLFDPRGVERSDPVTCGAATGSAPSDPAPSTPSQQAATIAGLKQFAAACEKTSPTLLPYVGTVDAARDMDRLRQALGDGALTYMGQSYGTLLGLTYASLFPTHIRAMVLDSVIDPALTFDQMTQGQAVGFENMLDAFFAWCAGSAACPWRPAGDPTTAIAGDCSPRRRRPRPRRAGATSRGWGSCTTRLLDCALRPVEVAAARRGAGGGRGRQRRTGRGPVHALQHGRLHQRRRRGHGHRLSRPPGVAEPGVVRRTGIGSQGHGAGVRSAARMGRGGLRRLARARRPGRSGRWRLRERRPSSWSGPRTTRPRPTPGRSAWPRSSTGACCSPMTATTTSPTSTAPACVPTCRRISSAGRHPPPGATCSS